MASLQRPQPSSPDWASRVGRHARDRWWLSRHRVRPARLALRLGLVAVVISGAYSLVGWGLRARQTVGAWGRLVPVAVAAADLQPGQVIGPGDLRTERWPEALIGDAPATVDDAVGRTVVHPILGGEAVATDRLGPGRLGLGPDEEAVTLVPPLVVPPVEVGDRVELFTVTDDSGDPTGGSTTTRRTAGGRVIAVNDDGVEASLTVAVPRSATADLVTAQATGLIEIVIAP